MKNRKDFEARLDNVERSLEIILAFMDDFKKRIGKLEAKLGGETP